VFPQDWQNQALLAEQFDEKLNLQAKKKKKNQRKKNE
jgi:hypothetical protein